MFLHWCGISSGFGLGDEVAAGETAVPVVRGKSPDTVDVADNAGRGNPFQQRGEVSIGQAIVERHIGYARKGGAEEGNRGSCTILVEQGDMRAAAARYVCSSTRAARNSAP